MLEKKSNSESAELQKERAMNNEFAYKIIVLSAELERIARTGGLAGAAKEK